MLHYRTELGLSPAQVDGLERLRAEFRREAIRREADLRVAEMDLGALRERDPVDLDRVEAKVREIERVRADLRLARIRAIEQGRALLSAEQRERLRALLGEPRMPARPLGPAPVPPPPPPPGGRL
jgi:Spy/CpxP family protein refolding chaperone